MPSPLILALVSSRDATQTHADIWAPRGPTELTQEIDRDAFYPKGMGRQGQGPGALSSECIWYVCAVFTGHPLPSTSAPEVERFPELVEEGEVPETQRLGRMGGSRSVTGGRMEGTRWPPGAQLWPQELDPANNPSECGVDFSPEPPYKDQPPTPGFLLCDASWRRHHDRQTPHLSSEMIKEAGSR